MARQALGSRLQSDVDVLSALNQETISQAEKTVTTSPSSTSVTSTLKMLNTALADREPTHEMKGDLEIEKRNLTAEFQWP